MLKKIVYALALTGLASGQALALTNVGFETGDTTGWVTPVGSLQALTSTTVQLIDDGYGVYPAIPVDLTPMVGSYFGLMSLPCSDPADAATCTSSLSFSINLGGPVAHNGDYLWVRFMTPDFRDDVSAAAYNDSVSVKYYGTSSLTELAEDSMSVDSLWTEDLNGDNTPDRNAFDSGWRGFFVPIGTNTITVSLANGPAGDMYNRPYVALDYQAAVVTPVPEAETSAMMLAGLGVMGLLARRRAKRAA